MSNNMFHELYGTMSDVVKQLNVLCGVWRTVRVVYLEVKPDKLGIFQGLAETTQEVWQRRGSGTRKESLKSGDISYEVHS
jgi:hypothetical protein